MDVIVVNVVFKKKKIGVINRRNVDFAEVLLFGVLGCACMRGCVVRRCYIDLYEGFE